MRESLRCRESAIYRVKECNRPWNQHDWPKDSLPHGLADRTLPQSHVICPRESYQPIITASQRLQESDLTRQERPIGCEISETGPRIRLPCPVDRTLGTSDSLAHFIGTSDSLTVRGHVWVSMTSLIGSDRSHDKCWEAVYKRVHGRPWESEFGLPRTLWPYFQSSDWQIWPWTLWQISLIQLESTASHGLPHGFTNYIENQDISNLRQPIAHLIAFYHMC